MRNVSTIKNQLDVHFIYCSFCVFLCSHENRGQFINYVTLFGGAGESAGFLALKLLVERCLEIESQIDRSFEHFGDSVA